MVLYATRYIGDALRAGELMGKVIERLMNEMERQRLSPMALHLSQVKLIRRDRGYEIYKLITPHEGPVWVPANYRRGAHNEKR